MHPKVYLRNKNSTVNDKNEKWINGGKATIKEILTLVRPNYFRYYQRLNNHFIVYAVLATCQVVSLAFFVVDFFLAIQELRGAGATGLTRPAATDF